LSNRSIDFIGMKKPSLLKVSLTANVLLLFCFLFLIFQTQIFRLFFVQEISPAIEKELAQLGGMALLSEDVPVGALVVYQNKIIGRGFNTVYRDENISGHAEINAINDAIQNTGLENFLGLDKSQIVVYSTFEPCEMCKGTLNHYRISNIKFVKDKTFLRWIKNYWADLHYESSKRQAGNESLQDSLFMLHPAYPGRE